MELDYDTVRLILFNARTHLLEKHGKDAVPLLIRALEDTIPIVRWNAAYVLGEIKDARAVGALINALEDPNKSVRHNAARALVEVGNESAVPALIKVMIKALEKNDSVMIRWSAWAVGKIRAASAVPALIRALEKHEWDVAPTAMEALTNIGEPAVPALIIALVNANSTVGFRVAKTLREIANEKGLRFVILIGKNEFGMWDYKNFKYSLEIGLEETRKMLTEITRMCEQDNNLATTSRVKLKLAEFYRKVVARHNKVNSGISVEGGELLKGTVKPPKDGIYQTIRTKQMVRI